MVERTKPLWIEIDEISNEETLYELIKKYELIFPYKIFDKYGIFLFGEFVKLSPQEYYFLLAVMKIGENPEGAENIMTTIGAKCDSKNFSLKSFSYRIRNKIKYKILEKFKNKRLKNRKNFYFFSPPYRMEWKTIDEYYKENNKKILYGEHANLQLLEFSKFIEEYMIIVEKGRYKTKFKKENDKKLKNYLNKNSCNSWILHSNQECIIRISQCGYDFEEEQDKN